MWAGGRLECVERSSSLKHQPRRLILLACTATKRSEPDLLPAIERYDGPSFRTLRKWQAANPVEAQHLDVLILSARLGLIGADTLISNYNLRMNPARAVELRDTVSITLTGMLAQRGPYAATLVHLGQDYLPAIGGVISQTPAYGFVTYTTGSIGVRLHQVKAWLNTDR